MPCNWQNTLHVEFDAVSGEYTGLPPEWVSLGSQAKFSDEEKKSYAQQILAAFQFQDALLKDEEENLMCPNLEQLGKISDI